MVCVIKFTSLCTQLQQSLAVAEEASKKVTAFYRESVERKLSKVRGVVCVMIIS